MCRAIIITRYVISSLTIQRGRGMFKIRSKKVDANKILSEFMAQNHVKEIVACYELEENMKVPSKKRVSSIKLINTSSGEFPYMQIAEGISESEFLGRWENYLKYFLEPELALRNSATTQDEKKLFGSKERFYKICEEHGIDV